MKENLMAGLPPDVVAGIETDAAAFAQQVAENTPLPHEPGGSAEPVGQQDAGATPSGDSGQASSGTQEPDAVEAPPAGEGTAPEVPAEYMGLDLSDIDPERRAAIIAHVEAQNQYITRLQQQQTTEPPKPAEPAQGAAAGQGPEPPGEFQMPADAEIIAAMGLDPESPDFESQVRVALPLAKVTLQLNDRVEALLNDREAEKVQTTWGQKLDQLETQFGKLDVPRDRLLAFANENGIANPEAAYWTIAGPARQAAATEATKARQEALTLLRAGASAGRPAGAPSETAQATIPKRDFSKPGTRRQESRNAFLDALRAAETDTGTTWRDAVAAEHDSLLNPPVSQEV